MAEICHIKPVKTNFRRTNNKNPNEIVASTTETHVITKNPDGTETIRVRRTFNTIKPLKKCQICGNQYKYQHALESHMRRHRNEKPFACE